MSDFSGVIKTAANSDRRHGDEHSEEATQRIEAMNAGLLRDARNDDTVSNRTFNPTHIFQKSRILEHLSIYSPIQSNQEHQ